MSRVGRVLRLAFDHLENALGRFFPAQWNPILNLGALGFFFYWVITATGIYLYIFFDTGVRDAYSSVEYMTNEQWYAAGVMRSLHRYASDGLVIVILLHLAREFSLDRYRGVRWLSWVTGVAVLIMIYISGITGYWLVWDRLGQYVAIVSTEWLDRLGAFAEPIARNFLHPGMLNDRFFTLMIFIHIAVPLFALIALWVHLQRVMKPRINPPRGLAVGVFASMLALSLAHPAVSQGPANLAEVPGKIGLDWFYFPLYPLLENLPGMVTWSAAATLTIIMVVMPWLPPLRRPPPAAVSLDNCNGCIRCFNDCPYGAITMVARSDGLPYEREPVVNESLCTSCGICAGSCPTSMPFRRGSKLVAGIDLPDHNMADLRTALHAAAEGLTGSQRIIVFGCEPCLPQLSVLSDKVATVSVRCIGQLPPAFIDYTLSRGLADGVALAGCRENNCYCRFGIQWTNGRLARERDPHLRARVSKDQLRVFWLGRLGGKALNQLLLEFANTLGEMKPRKPLRAEREAEDQEQAHV